MTHQSSRRARPARCLSILLLCGSLLLPTLSPDAPRSASAAPPRFPDSLDLPAPDLDKARERRLSSPPSAAEVAAEVEAAAGTELALQACDVSDPSGDADGDGIPNGIEPVEGRNPCLKDNDIFANARLFVRQQYRDFLGREGDEDGINFWVGQINSGAQTRAQAIQTFFNSSEFQATTPVTRLYFAYFLRIPDYDGLQFWVGQYRAGVSLEAISQAFASSAEFINRYGSLTNQEFVSLVYQNVLGRAADPGGLAYWTGQLNSGAMTRGQVMLAFSESAENLAASLNKVFVVQTYVGMLRRSPDPGGFDFWLGQLNGGGSGLDLIGSFLAASEYRNRFLPVADQPASYAEAQADPYNRTGLPGEDLLSRNYNWSLPLLGLAGRAGLDLGLSLVYNSLVWTRSGPGIKFDADRGYPAPGFRLGFPVIQPRYVNSQAGAGAYLLITPSGSRVELRQVGSSATYESADSSYVQLIEGNPYLLLTPDGSRLEYHPFGGQYHCTRMTDRNGNFISASYNGDGRLGAITDTLGRAFSFNYNGDGTLASISQLRNGQPHTWAAFAYTALTLQTTFSAAVEAPPTIRALTRVTLEDGSYVTFQHSSWGQVYRINQHAADDHLLTYTAYDLPVTAGAAYADCPHFTERKDWAENWMGGAEVTTGFQFDLAARSFGEVTAPDGTGDREVFHTAGFRRGLVAEAQVRAGGQTRKRTTLEWTQDDPNLAYRKNPRVTESNVYDEANNRRRTVISYTPTFGLPSDVYEYDQSAATVLRRTHTDYNLTSAYINTTRRLIGLVTAQLIYEGATGPLASRREYAYDLSGFLQDQGEPAQHDAAYGAGFLQGRGNLCRARRYDILNSTFVDSLLGYNTTGSVVFVRDPLNHQMTIGYGDSFSDGQNRNTLAYATAVTDAAGFASTAQYQYDIGALTRRQDPKGAAQSYQYDAAGRVERVMNLVSGAYTRFVYADTHTLINSYTTVTDGQGEAFGVQVLDGAGRVRYTASEFPGSAGGYRAVHTIYDGLGRVLRQSNPTESFSNWAAAGDDAVAGWVYSEQAYDWQGRPTVMTHPDGTTRELSYSGCGCAGGSAVTIRDEAGRRQKIYSDVLGRVVKTETLNPDLSVYETTTSEYNARDQVTRERQYAGAATAGCPGGGCQETVLTYDGHGRLKTRRLPIEESATSYDYFTDDTLQRQTDARGAQQTFAYNSRHLLTAITHIKPPQSAPEPEAGPLAVHKGTDATFAYDEAGNRLWMQETNNGAPAGRTDYAYDTQSQLALETRTIPGVGTFPLSYTYTLSGQLASLTDPFNATVSYGYDRAGQLTSVTGSGYGGTTQLASAIQYRASGALKQLTRGGINVVFNYNSRHLLTGYTINGHVTAYQYYADGRARHSRHPNGSPEFDRAYVYDQAGRLTQAMAGGAAQEPPTAAVETPYLQTYQYDGFGHMTQRTSALWGHELNPFTATYVNDRKTGWQYDEAGNLKLDQMSNQYTYNTVSQVSVWVQGGDTITQNYDGDGQPAKRTETRQTPFFASTINYVRSSVLGGEVVVELNAAGQRKAVHLYALGGMLAKYQRPATDLPFGLDFVYEEPVSGDRTEGGRSFSTDPLGGLVPGSDPFVANPMAGYGDLLGQREGHVYDADPFDTGGGCTLDGVPVNCEELQRLAQNGAVDAQISSGVKQRTVPVSGLIAGRSGYWLHQPSSPQDLPDGRLGVSDVPAYEYVSDSGGGQDSGLPAGRSAMQNVLALAPRTALPSPVFGRPCADKAVEATPRRFQQAAATAAPGILTEADAIGLSDAQTAYVLATALHESGMGFYKKEVWSGKGLQRSYSRTYSGRGYVQLTHKNNYQYWGNRLQLDLVNNPDLASDPGVAAHILVAGMAEGRFYGRNKLSKYVGGKQINFFGARSVVNGDKNIARPLYKNGPRVKVGHVVARYAMKYFLALWNCY